MGEGAAWPLLVERRRYPPTRRVAGARSSSELPFLLIQPGCWEVAVKLEGAD